MALLEAAARLYEGRGIEEVSLNAIAREANISKGNVYRYFESREELFLQLTLEAYQEWSEDLIGRLNALGGAGDERAVAKVFATTIMAHPRYAKLSSVLSTVLERNVSVEAVVRFKQAYFGALEPLSNAVGAALPDLNADELWQLVEASYFWIVSMWPAAHPAPAVREALQRPELQQACIDFQPRFEQQVLTMIRGLRAGHERA